MGAVIGVQYDFGRRSMRVMPGYLLLVVLGVVGQVRFKMGSGMVPCILVIAPAVLALALGGQVPGRFFPMVVLVFTVFFHTK